MMFLHPNVAVLAFFQGTQLSVKGVAKVDQCDGVKGSHLRVCEGCWGLRGRGPLERSGRGPRPREARLAGLGVGVPFAAALFEAEAVAVHLEDVDVVGEAVEQCPGESF